MKIESAVIMEIIRRRLLLLVISLAAIFVIHVYTVAAQGPVRQLIRDSCQQATNPDFCISVLSSDPRSQGRKYPGQLAFLAILISNEKAKEGMRYVSDVEKKTTDPLTKNILNYCVDRYDVGPVGGTENAIEDFNNGSKRLAAIDMSSIFGPLDECDRRFQRPPYPVNEIGRTNELMRKYGVVALDLIHLVERN